MNIGLSMERRNKDRFPLRINTEVRIGAYSFRAVTRDISSQGMFIVSSVKVPLNELVTLRLDWPARLHGSTPLAVKAMGRVERITSDGFAVSYDSVRFRTARRVEGESAA